MKKKEVTPFIGLKSFEEHEKHFFFGRTKQTQDIITNIENSTFSAIIGASGSGKSSLIKSGLIPTIKKSSLNGFGWKIAMLSPGYDPIGNLAECLINERIINTESTKDVNISDILRNNLNGINDVLERFSNNTPENILLIVDQFEEIFKFSDLENMQTNSPKDATLFVNLLLNTLKSKKVFIVLSMRSDYLGNCTRFLKLPEALNRGQYLVPRMTKNELKDVIVQPITLINATISDSLVTLLLDHISHEQGQLPILQHALMRMVDFWRKESNSKGPIGIQHYTAIGGLDKALSNHADEAFLELKDSESKLICEVIFKALTAIGPNSKGIRRPCKLSELSAQLNISQNKIIEIIDVFRPAGRSFLTPPISEKITGEDLIDISHESLMREWDRLKFWLSEEADSSKIYLHLCEVAKLHQEGKGSLLTNPELEVTLLWKERTNPNEKWALRYDKTFARAMSFLDQSKENYDFIILQKEITQKNKIKRTKIFSTVISFAFIVALGLAVASWVLYDDAEKSKLKAQNSEKSAKQSEELAKNSEKEAKTSRDRALIEEVKAKAAAEEAKKAKLIAQQSDLQARFARDRALLEEVKAKEAAKAEKRAAKEAIAAQKQARISANEAIEAEKKAYLAKDEADRLKNISESIKEAFQSLKNFDVKNYKKGTELALKSHEKFRINSKEKRNSDIYLALNRALVEGKNDGYYEHKYGIKNVVINSKFNKIAIIDAKGDFLLNTDDKWRSFRPSEELNLQQNISCLNFSKDGEYLLVGTKNGTLNVLKPNAQKGIYNILNFENEILSVHSSIINGTNYMLVLEGNNCHLLRRTKREINIESSIKIPVPNFKINYVHPDFSKIIISNESKAIIYSIALEAQKITVLEVNRIENSNKISTIEMSSNGKYLALGLNNGSINLVTLDKNMNSKSSKTISLHRSKVSDIKFIINKEESLLISSSYDNTINMVNILNTLDNISLKGHNGWVQQIGLSPDNRRIISVSEDKTLRNWFIYTGDIVKLLNKN